MTSLFTKSRTCRGSADVLLTENSWCFLEASVRSESRSCLGPRRDLSYRLDNGAHGRAGVDLGDAVGLQRDDIVVGMMPYEDGDVARPTLRRAAGSRGPGGCELESTEMPTRSTSS